MKRTCLYPPTGRGLRAVPAAVLAIGLLAVGLVAAGMFGLGNAGLDNAGLDRVGAIRPGSRPSPGAVAQAVVMAAPGAEQAAEQATLALGGWITRRLPVINGFAAEIPAGTVSQLAMVPAVASVTPDRTLQASPATAAGSAGGSTGSKRPVPGAAAAKGRTGNAGPAGIDTGSPAAVTELTGAREAWAAGDLGQGVDVALIDTGITPVPGLDEPGKVLVGPDLSLDAPGADGTGADGYGHGTFMAGIIAGHDAGSTPGDPSAFTGVAPGARLVDVKVGASDGATDVSQVIAAIDWVTQHAHDPGLNIRVLNLSFGTDGDQNYRIDPLAQATEQAWRHGIVVVAAAGNDGKATQDLADPAYDPFLLAVGGDDPNGTLDPADDSVPSFAQHGTEARTVDVIAPATHLLGLRVPGSYVDTLSSNTGRVGTRFQRGSGTSEAAAVVSGLAALLVQRYPSAGPDQVKALLTGTATPVLRGSGNPAAPGQRLYSGHGLVDLTAALAGSPDGGDQHWPIGTGTGSLDGSRGSAVLAEGGLPLTGQQDIFGRPFDSAAMAAAQAAGQAWAGGTWNGSRWTGDGWTGSRWTTAVWTGANWAGLPWTGSRWTTLTWTGSRWTDSGWSGARWAAAGWG